MLHQQELWQTAIAILAFFLLRFIFGTLVSRRIKKLGFHVNRRKMITKSATLILFLVVVSAVASIWGVDQSEILIFLSSVLTVLGVAFFAQWSHLSNITSGIILFFNSNIKIGDEIQIMDKEFDLTGTIMDIEALFIILKNKDGELLNIPNNIILQKVVKINNPNK